jgi:hypothetical protein
MKPLMTSTALLAATLFMGPALAQNQQQVSGTGQFCIKGASGPIKCEYQTMALCEQARPSGSTDQCVPRSEAGTVGRAPAPAPGEQKD